MSSYQGPTPNIPTYFNVNILPEDQSPLRNQLEDQLQTISYILNDKKRRDQYLNIEDITTDTYIDGKPIFRKLIDTGVLLQGATNNIPHGIVTIDKLVNIFINVSNGTNQRMLGYASPTIGNTASVDVDATNIVIVTGATFGMNYSGEAYIFYTKL